MPNAIVSVKFNKISPRLKNLSGQALSGLRKSSKMLFMAPLAFAGSCLGFEIYNSGLDMSMLFDTNLYTGIWETFRNESVFYSLFAWPSLKISLWLTELGKQWNNKKVSDINIKKATEERLQRSVSLMVQAQRNQDWPAAFKHAQAILSTAKGVNPTFIPLANECEQEAKPIGQTIGQLLNSLQQADLQNALPIAQQLINIVSPALSRKRTELGSLLQNWSDVNKIVFENRIKEHFGDIIIAALNDAYDAALKSHDYPAVQQIAKDLLDLSDISAADKLAEVKPIADLVVEIKSNYLNDLPNAVQYAARLVFVVRQLSGLNSTLVGDVEALLTQIESQAESSDPALDQSVSQLLAHLGNTIP